MNRGARIRLCLVVLLMAGSGQLADAAGTPSKPNIVYIVADDGAYSDFGFSARLNGLTPYTETPNIDALAAQGVIGAQAYVSHSLCGPSRAGILTGQFSQRIGFENNPGNWAGDSVNGNWVEGIRADSVILPQRLKTLGYATGIVGKWHEGYQPGVNLPEDRFDESFVMHDGGRSYWNYAGVNDYDHGIWKNGVYYEHQWPTEGDHSLYDPTRGRYLTDAFGEEDANYINRHANDSNPFFLYAAFTTPHEPLDAKQSDLDHFANVTTSDAQGVNRRAIAAMTYALDRAVGKITSTLKADGLDNNTIIVFTNDNGAVSYIGNPPFKGQKGTMWEGGIRVPFTIKGPGLTAGSVYNSPLTVLDVNATLLKAAGADLSTIPHDGYDMMPELKGQTTEPNTVARVWRNFDSWAVRKGDWKLTIQFSGITSKNLFNIKNNPAEDLYLQSQNPGIVADLSNELTKWEVQMDKPHWGDIGAWDQNLVDAFTFRNNVASTSNWNSPNQWAPVPSAMTPSPGATATLKPADAYANAVLEFTTRNDASYTANNNMKRMSLETFMLNQFKFTGNFGGSANQQGNLTGNPVLMVTSLAGQLPQIHLDATSNGTPSNFTFAINNEIQLYNDLTISGDGTQNFVFNGQIRDYYESLAPTNPLYTVPHNVTKSGASVVTFAGNNTFGGRLTINGGRVNVSGATATVNGASAVVVNSGGTLGLSNGGTITTGSLTIAFGGSMEFTGGTLKTPSIIGNLTNNGGTLSSGNSIALATIAGSYNQTGNGTLQIKIGGVTPGSEFDKFAVTGPLTLAGALVASFSNGYNNPGVGQGFQILSATAGVTGQFDNYILPGLPSGRQWNILYDANTVSLIVTSSAGPGQTIPGDYNRDGIVNTADYVLWRKGNGLSVTNLGDGADGNHDGVVDSRDYDVWSRNLGMYYVSGGSGGESNSASALIEIHNAPEPAGALLFFIAAAAADRLKGRVRREPTLAQKMRDQRRNSRLA